MGFIYRIYNKANGKSYIGQTKNLKKRWYSHVWSSKSHDRHSLISRAIHKYGIENFDFLILEEGLETQEEIDLLEVYYIAYFDTNSSRGGSGYNLTDGGEGVKGLKMSKGSKRLMSKKKKDLYLQSPQVIEKISKSVKKLWEDEEYRKKNMTLCPVDKQTLLKESEGLVWDDIAIKFHVSTTTIKRWFSIYKIEKPKVVSSNSRKSWSQEEIKTLLTLRQRGFLVNEIARLMNRSTCSIRKMLQRSCDLHNVSRSRYFRKK